MISRRQLAAWGALAGAAGLLPSLPAHAAPHPLVKPRRLRRGDTVGLVLPASKEAAAWRLDMAQEQLEALGLRVRWGKNARRQHGYFAGTDAERAADVNAFFADPEIAAIVCYTGGWGTPRILPLLDYPVIRANPKILLGFSDITALLNGIHLETGLVTFHGPVGDVGLRPWTRAQLERVLLSAEPIGTLANPPKEDQELVPRTYRSYAIRGGQARGRLVGGNLTLLASLMGTPWEVDTKGAILLVEDIREAPYRIDRMLTQLALGGKLAEVAGVVFGFCTECDAEGPSFSLEEVLRDRFEPLGVPVLAGFAFGHIAQQLTLPIGLAATLDASAATLAFDEAAVT